MMQLGLVSCIITITSHSAMITCESVNRISEPKLSFIFYLIGLTSAKLRILMTALSHSGNKIMILIITLCILY